MAARTGVILAPARNLQHPLLARFRPLAGSVPWDAFPVWEYWRFDDVEKTKGVAVVIPYSDGRPALFERLVAGGRVLVMTTPMSDAASDRNAWNQLATGFKPWPFVMLSNETLLYLVGSGEERLNYTVGQRAVLRLEEEQTQSVFALKTPDGSARRRPHARSGQSPGERAGTTAAGNYRIQAGGTRRWHRPRLQRQHPAGCHRANAAEARGARRVLGNGRFHLAHSREEIDRNVSVGRVGRELFPLLIVLVALRWPGTPARQSILSANRCTAPEPRRLVPPESTRHSPPIASAAACCTARYRPTAVRPRGILHSSSIRGHVPMTSWHFNPVGSYGLVVAVSGWISRAAGLARAGAAAGRRRSAGCIGRAAIGSVSGDRRRAAAADVGVHRDEAPSSVVIVLVDRSRSCRSATRPTAKVAGRCCS